jgi:uncharacterized damage-inducible protein DinB
MSTESLFLEASAAALRQCNERIAKCLAKLNDDQIWARGNENENAIGNLVLHLAGNVRQWLISGLGGQPDIRVRDREFLSKGGYSAEELAALLGGTVEEAVAELQQLDSRHLVRTYAIQNQQVSGVEAVLSVVRHFAEHTGQIIFATKNMTGADLKLWGPKPAAAKAQGPASAAPENGDARP